MRQSIFQCNFAQSMGSWFAAGSLVPSNRARRVWGLRWNSSTSLSRSVRWCDCACCASYNVRFSRLFPFFECAEQVCACVPQTLIHPPTDLSTYSSGAAHPMVRRALALRASVRRSPTGPHRRTFWDPENWNPFVWPSYVKSGLASTLLGGCIWYVGKSQAEWAAVRVPENEVRVQHKEQDTSSPEYLRSLLKQAVSKNYSPQPPADTGRVSVPPIHREAGREGVRQERPPPLMPQRLHNLRG